MNKGIIDWKLTAIGTILFAGFVYVASNDKVAPAEIVSPVASTSAKFSGSERQEYISGCMDEGAGQAYCSCTLTYLEGRHSRRDIMQMGLDYERNGQIPSPMWEAIEACYALN